MNNFSRQEPCDLVLLLYLLIIVDVERKLYRSREE
jgi:hypothetical protein